MQIRDGLWASPEGIEHRQARLLPSSRAIIDLDADAAAYKFPGGSAAQVALYTPYWHHFAIIRRILLRMRSWQNYVFLEGH